MMGAFAMAISGWFGVDSPGTFGVIASTKRVPLREARVLGMQPQDTTGAVHSCSLKAT